MTLFIPQASAYTDPKLRVCGTDFFRALYVQISFINLGLFIPTSTKVFWLLQYPLNLLVPITLVLAGSLLVSTLHWPRKNRPSNNSGFEQALLCVFETGLPNFASIPFSFGKKMLYLPKSFVSHRRIAIQGRCIARAACQVRGVH